MSSNTAMVKTTHALAPLPVAEDVALRRIRAALKTMGGNIGTAAILMGMSVSTFRRHMRAVGIAPAKRGPKPKKKGKRR